MSTAAPIAEGPQCLTGPGAALAVMWETQDRTGRIVILTSERLNHILREHEDMAVRMDAVRNAIEQPDFVTRDREYRHRENHYRSTRFRPPLLKVVVHYRPIPPQGAWAGEIITAFPLRQRDPREELLTP